MTTTSDPRPVSAPTSAPTSAPGNPFWTFSLDLYASTEVQAACLELQDVAGVDVNVMLYLLWLAAYGQALSDAEIGRVLATVEPWKSGVVVPLRTTRRKLKEPPAGFATAATQELRTIVKKAELEAERLQQTTLFGLRPVGTRVAGGEAVVAARSNLAGYGRALGRELAAAPAGVMLRAFEVLLARRG